MSKGGNEATETTAFWNWWFDQRERRPHLVLDADEDLAHAAWRAAIMWAGKRGDGPVGEGTKDVQCRTHTPIQANTQ